MSWMFQMSDPVLEPPPCPCVPTTTHHDCTILRATGNDIIIVWAPGDVQHGGRVAADRGHVLVHTSSLEGTTGPLRELLFLSKRDPASPHPFREEGSRIPGRPSRA